MPLLLTLAVPLARLLAVGAGGVTFSPPVLITPLHSFVGGKEVDWHTGYSDLGARLSDDHIIWQTGNGGGNALEYGAPIYESTNGGASWVQAAIHDSPIINSVIPDPTAQKVGLAVRGWGQLAADPCSPNRSHQPNDLNQTWSRMDSTSCWQEPCEPPVTFGITPSNGALSLTNFSGGTLSIDFLGHEVWCFNQTEHPAITLSVSGATALSDGSWLQTLAVFWGGGKAKPDSPGAAASAAHPFSWGNFSSCSNINGRVPIDWTPYFPQTSIIALHASPPFTNWTLHGVVANASDYPCATEGPIEHDIVRLVDGRLMTIFRTDGGDGHGWQPYSQTFSEDEGRSWSHGKMMANGLQGVNGTARPRLLRLPSGPILLAGGRYTKDSSRWTPSWCVEPRSAST